HQRPEPGTRVEATQVEADGDVPDAPDEGDERERGEGGRRQACGDLQLADAAGRRNQRDGAHGQGERRHADQRRQNAPDDEENADEVDAGRGGHAAEDRTATRTSTRTEASAFGDEMRKRNRAPSATPGGSQTRT